MAEGVAYPLVQLLMFLLGCFWMFILSYDKSKHVTHIQRGILAGTKTFEMFVSRQPTKYERV